eukprot:14817689-Alexandrium_andersonii.AAC.1
MARPRGSSICHSSGSRRSTTDGTPRSQLGAPCCCTGHGPGCCASSRMPGAGARCSATTWSSPGPASGRSCRRRSRALASRLTLGSSTVKSRTSRSRAARSLQLAVGPGLAPAPPPAARRCLAPSGLRDGEG